MQTYWVKRAQTTFDAVKRLAAIMGKEQEQLTALWIKESQVLDDDKRTEHFGNVLTKLLSGLTNRHRVAALESRKLALKEIAEPGGLDPHCEHCAKNPMRPQTYWDYRRYIDERTFMALCHLALDDLDTGQKVKLTVALLEWHTGRARLEAEAQPEGAAH